MPNLPARQHVFPTTLAALLLLLPRPAPAAQTAPAIAPPDSGSMPARLLERRRTALLERLEPGIVVVRSADQRELDEYPQDSDFRQDNSFYYLTGLETPGSWLVMFKSTRGSENTVLYLPERDPQAERWTGPKIGPGEQAQRTTGIDVVRPASLFESEVLRQLRMPAAMSEFPQLYVPLGELPPEMRELVDAALRWRRSVTDLNAPLAELRLLKDSVELARLRRAIAITTEAQREAMKAARAGMREYELEAVIEYVFRSLGAERVGFPTIVGSGPNSVILHYDKNRRRMEEGDLVVIDAGAEYGYYTADITRTFPVSGRFTARQRAIYELVLATQRAVIDSVRPGVTAGELGGIARRFMDGHSDGLCGEESCGRYFVHGLGHWLGMDVHDVGDYSRPLEPGMVLTIEPGIYLPEEDLGVRIEDDVLVTEAGHEVLSRGAPKAPDEIEALMREEPCLLGCNTGDSGMSSRGFGDSGN